MQKTFIESLMGVIVLAAAGFFFIYAASHTQRSSTGSEYRLNAAFINAEGLAPGQDVRLSGVKVGRVEAIKLNAANFMADVTLAIADHVKLPKDSLAVIANESLLGGHYLSLEPGSEPEKIPAGGEIIQTQAAVSLEKLMGQMIYSVKNAPAANSPPTTNNHHGGGNGPAVHNPPLVSTPLSAPASPASNDIP
ncbi:MAG: outer membrane lipid asymmetry maintenance protein MlaD [Alphaproteobacteria bacterium]